MKFFTLLLGVSFLHLTVTATNNNSERSFSNGLALQVSEEFESVFYAQNLGAWISCHDALFPLIGFPEDLKEAIVSVLAVEPFKTKSEIYQICMDYLRGRLQDMGVWDSPAAQKVYETFKEHVERAFPHENFSGNQAVNYRSFSEDFVPISLSSASAIEPVSSSSSSVFNHVLLQNYTNSSLSAPVETGTVKDNFIDLVDGKSTDEDVFAGEFKMESLDHTESYRDFTFEDEDDDYIVVPNAAKRNLDIKENIFDLPIESKDLEDARAHYSSSTSNKRRIDGELDEKKWKMAMDKVDRIPLKIFEFTQKLADSLLASKFYGATAILQNLKNKFNRNSLYKVPFTEDELMFAFKSEVFDFTSELDVNDDDVVGDFCGALLQIGMDIASEIEHETKNVAVDSFEPSEKKSKSSHFLESSPCSTIDIPSGISYSSHQEDTKAEESDDESEIIELASAEGLAKPENRAILDDPFSILLETFTSLDIDRFNHIRSLYLGFAEHEFPGLTRQEQDESQNSSSTEEVQPCELLQSILDRALHRVYYKR